MVERNIAEGHAPSRPPRLMIVVVIVAMLLIGFASLFMVQMPGSLSSMLASILPF